MRIGIVSWNTQSARFEKLDFIEAMLEPLNSPELIVISLQEDRMREDIVISRFTERLTDYKIVELVELSGWGSTTYKALKSNLEYLPRGLRLAVYIKKELEIKSTVSSWISPGLKDQITWGKGMVCVNLELDGKRVTIANMHLPFDSRSLTGDRKQAADWQLFCLKYLYSNIKSDNVILTGDLNFRVVCPAEDLLFDPDYNFIYRNYDELYSYLEKDPELSDLKERHIDFAPSCKLRQGRISGDLDYNTGKRMQRTPSWCDRIIYKGELECCLYDRLDYGEMNLSDHCAVIGILRCFE